MQHVSKKTNIRLTRDILIPTGNCGFRKCFVNTEYWIGNRNEIFTKKKEKYCFSSTYSTPSCLPIFLFSRWEMNNLYGAHLFPKRDKIFKEFSFPQISVMSRVFNIEREEVSSSRGQKYIWHNTNKKNKTLLTKEYLNEVEIISKLCYRV